MTKMLLAAEVENATCRSKAEPVAIWKARKYIEERSGEKLSLPRVAKEVNVHPNYLSEKFKQEQRVWIVREEAGIYAIFAKCTHLGCTPRWLAAENKFKCPCHGSGFFK